MHMLTRIDLKGYKSIKDASLELRPLNVLIGANGSGKSNFVSFFKLINQMVKGYLQAFVAKQGGATSLLHYGPKVTQRIAATLHFKSDDSESEYCMELGHAAEDTLVILQEWTAFNGETGSATSSYEKWPESGHKETRLSLPPEPIAPSDGIRDPFDVMKTILDHCRVFQFHDTSSTANMRQNCDINRNRSLESDGGNLAAIVYKIKKISPDCYQRIVGTIRQIAPFFGDFNLAPSALNAEVIQLRWKERGQDYDFGPHLLSDGTLRVMALVTLLLQPTKDLPPIIIIDEPELGLHPYAIATLAGLLKSASLHAQIIVATESATLLDQFEPEDVVVTERSRGVPVSRVRKTPLQAEEVSELSKGETVFERLDSKELQEWRERYTLSELWEKNVFGGGPASWSV
jgi:predicted ATPase